MSHNTFNGNNTNHEDNYRAKFPSNHAVNHLNYDPSKLQTAFTSLTSNTKMSESQNNRDDTTATTTTTGQNKNDPKPNSKTNTNDSSIDMSPYQSTHSIDLPTVPIDPSLETKAMQIRHIPFTALTMDEIRRRRTGVNRSMTPAQFKLEYSHTAATIARQLDLSIPTTLPTLPLAMLPEAFHSAQLSENEKNQRHPFIPPPPPLPVDDILVDAPIKVIQHAIDREVAQYAVLTQPQHSTEQQQRSHRSSIPDLSNLPRFGATIPNILELEAPLEHLKQGRFQSLIDKPLPTGRNSVRLSDLITLHASLDPTQTLPLDPDQVMIKICVFDAFSQMLMVEAIVTDDMPLSALRDVIGIQCPLDQADLYNAEQGVCRRIEVERIQDVYLENVQSKFLLESLVPVMHLNAYRNTVIMDSDEDNSRKARNELRRSALERVLKEFELEIKFGQNSLNSFEKLLILSRVQEICQIDLGIELDASIVALADQANRDMPLTRKKMSIPRIDAIKATRNALLKFEKKLKTDTELLKRFHNGHIDGKFLSDLQSGKIIDLDEECDITGEQLDELFQQFSDISIDGNGQNGSENSQSEESDGISSRTTPKLSSKSSSLTSESLISHKAFHQYQSQLNNALDENIPNDERALYTGFEAIVGNCSTTTNPNIGQDPLQDGLESDQNENNTVSNSRYLSDLSQLISTMTIYAEMIGNKEYQDFVELRKYHWDPLLPSETHPDIVDIDEANDIGDRNMTDKFNTKRGQSTRQHRPKSNSTALTSSSSSSQTTTATTTTTTTTTTTHTSTLSNTIPDPNPSTFSNIQLEWLESEFKHLVGSLNFDAKLLSNPLFDPKNDHFHYDIHRFAQWTIDPDRSPTYQTSFQPPPTLGDHFNTKFKSKLGRGDTVVSNLQALHLKIRYLEAFRTWAQKWYPTVIRERTYRNRIFQWINLKLKTHSPASKFTPDANSIETKRITRDSVNYAINPGGTKIPPKVFDPSSLGQIALADWVHYFSNPSGVIMTQSQLEQGSSHSDKTTITQNDQNSPNINGNNNDSNPQKNPQSSNSFVPLFKPGPGRVTPLQTASFNRSSLAPAAQFPPYLKHRAIMEKPSHWPQKAYGWIPETLTLPHPSSFFYINNTFYDDRRSPLSISLSDSIVKHSVQHHLTYDIHSLPVFDENGIDLTQSNQTLAQQRHLHDGVGIFNQKRQEDVTFAHIPIRIGEQYLFQHQGHCQHIVMFTEIRIKSTEDFNDKRMYPLVIFRSDPNYTHRQRHLNLFVKNGLLRHIPITRDSSYTSRQYDLDQDSLSPHYTVGHDGADGNLITAGRSISSGGRKNLTGVFGVGYGKTKQNSITHDPFIEHLSQCLSCDRSASKLIYGHHLCPMNPTPLCDRCEELLTRSNAHENGYRGNGGVNLPSLKNNFMEHINAIKIAFRTKRSFQAINYTTTFNTQIVDRVKKLQASHPSNRNDRSRRLSLRMRSLVRLIKKSTAAMRAHQNVVLTEFYNKTGLNSISNSILDSAQVLNAIKPGRYGGDGDLSSDLVTKSTRTAAALKAVLKRNGKAGRGTKKKSKKSTMNDGDDDHPDANGQDSDSSGSDNENRTKPKRPIQKKSQDNDGNGNSADQNDPNPPMLRNNQLLQQKYSTIPTENRQKALIDIARRIKAVNLSPSIGQPATEQPTTEDNKRTKKDNKRTKKANKMGDSDNDSDNDSSSLLSSNSPLQSLYDQHAFIPYKPSSFPLNIFDPTQLTEFHQYQQQYQTYIQQVDQYNQDPDPTYPPPTPPAEFDFKQHLPHFFTHLTPSQHNGHFPQTTLFNPLPNTHSAAQFNLPKAVLHISDALVLDGDGKSVVSPGGYYSNTEMSLALSHYEQSQDPNEDPNQNPIQPFLPQNSTPLNISAQYQTKPLFPLSTTIQTKLPTQVITVKLKKKMRIVENIQRDLTQDIPLIPSNRHLPAYNGRREDGSSGNGDENDKDAPQFVKISNSEINMKNFDANCTNAENLTEFWSEYGSVHDYLQQCVGITNNRYLKE